QPKNSHVIVGKRIGRVSDAPSTDSRASKSGAPKAHPMKECALQAFQRDAPYGLSWDSGAHQWMLLPPNRSRATAGTSTRHQHAGRHTDSGHRASGHHGWARLGRTGNVL